MQLRAGWRSKILDQAVKPPAFNWLLRDPSLDATVRSSGCGDDVTRVGDLIFCDLPNLIRQEGDDSNGASRQRHEFHRAALAAFVNEHNRADVVRGQTVLGQVGRQHYAVEFFNRVIHPKDKLLLV
jgi:hypothetical protein